MGRLADLHAAAVSVWLDTLSRELLETGEFERLVQDAVTGATSNATILAITGSDHYGQQLRRAVDAGVQDPQEFFFELGLDDIHAAAEILRPVYEATAGRDGFVSFECTPDLADDAQATTDQALTLWRRLSLPNVMIKVPATAAGVVAIEELTAQGVNVKVTLLLDRALRAGHRRPPRRARAPRRRRPAAERPGVGRVVLRLTRRRQGRRRVARRLAATRRDRARQRPSRLRALPGALHERWNALPERRANPQRPLWASTGTKDPERSDVPYVEGLIAPGVINTMPEPKLRAFADRGRVQPPLAEDPVPARALLDQAALAPLGRVFL